MNRQDSNTFTHIPPEPQLYYADIQSSIPTSQTMDRANHSQYHPPRYPQEDGILIPPRYHHAPRGSHSHTPRIPVQIQPQLREPRRVAHERPNYPIRSRTWDSSELFEAPSKPHPYEGTRVYRRPPYPRTGYDSHHPHTDLPPRPSSRRSSYMHERVIPAMSEEGYPYIPKSYPEASRPVQEIRPSYHSQPRYRESPPQRSTSPGERKPRSEIPCRFHAAGKCARNDCQFKHD